MTTKVTDEARIDLNLTKKDAIQFWLTLINEYHFTSVFHWSGKEKVNKCPEMRYSENDFNGLFKSYLHYFREAYVLGFKFWNSSYGAQSSNSSFHSDIVTCYPVLWL